MKNHQILCSLHGLPFTLYCDRCLEPVCQKCTIIGPHHTSIHSLTQFPQAYERRVQELSTRLSGLSERNRDNALTEITRKTQDIELLRLKTKEIHSEHDRFREGMINRLIKSFENILTSLSSDSENLQELMDAINDLGHQFEAISANSGNEEGEESEGEKVKSDILCIVNYEKIMGEMKEVLDKLEILLTKNTTVVQLPKELTEIRLKLKEIETHEEIHAQKIVILKEIYLNFYKELSQIQAPIIDYPTNLNRIDSSLKEFDSELQREQNGKLKDGVTLRKIHNVCHFCGIIMDNHTINTACQKNTMTELAQSIDDKCNFCHPGQDPSQIKTTGYCKETPDIARFGTHRHYFGEPANQNKFYKVAFLRQQMGSESLKYLMLHIPEAEERLQSVNYALSSQQNSFYNYLNVLFYKIKTICKIKKINLKTLFEKEDYNKSQKTGFCDLVAMEYILIEILGLLERQAKILIDVTEVNRMGQNQVEDARNYLSILTKLEKIQIQ